MTTDICEARATLSSEDRKAGEQQHATKADDGAQAEAGGMVFEDDSVAARLHAQRAHDEVGSRQPGRLAIHRGAPARVILLDEGYEALAAAIANGDHPLVGERFHLACPSAIRRISKRGTGIGRGKQNRRTSDHV
jgi:hypothetical protein